MNHLTYFGYVMHWIALDIGFLFPERRRHKREYPLEALVGKFVLIILPDDVMIKLILTNW